MISRNVAGLKNEKNIQSLLDLISQKGDERALKTIFEIYSPGLYCFVFSILKNKELAEEAVSDVFFKVWAHRSRMSQLENFKAYIYTVARKNTLNYLDQKKQIIPAEDFGYLNNFSGVTSEPIFKEIQKTGFLSFSVFLGFDQRKSVSGVRIENLSCRANA